MGIIGVVAALTMPSIIEKHRKHVVVTRAKQNYVILNNAIERAKADYGMDVSNWEWLDNASNKEKSVYFAEKYMLPYLNTVAYSGYKPMDQVINLEGYEGDYAKINTSSGVSFVLNNGALVYLLVGFVNNTEGESGKNYNRVTIVYDIDGAKGFNLYGKDIFRVELGGLDGWHSQSMISRNRFLPYHYDSSKKCEEYLSSSFVGQHGCNGVTKYACLAYLMCNGWQVDDKYPW